MLPLSDNDITTLVQQYLTGISLIALGHRYGIDRGTVRNILIRRHIPIRSLGERSALLCKFSLEQQAEICRRYQAGERIVTLKHIFSVSRTAIENCLLRAGLALPGIYRYTCNEAAFDAPMTERKAYWLGMLMADGFVFYDKRSRAGHLYTPMFGLSLHARDAAHVELFRVFLHATHPLRRVIHPGYAAPGYGIELRITSQRLVDAMSRFGVIPHKSKRGEVHIIDKDRHFWRGMIDGDGSITVDRRVRQWYAQLTLVGHKHLMQSFAYFIHAAFPHISPSVRPSKSIWTVQLKGKHALEILHYLYEPCSIAMARKLFRAKSLLHRQMYFQF